MVGTYIQWLTRSEPGSSSLTLVSAWTLIQQLAQTLHTFCGYMAQDRWWPADGPPPEPYSVLSYELRNDVRYKAEAPGLSAKVRVNWQPTPHYPPLEEWPHTFEGVPTFQARVDESSPKPQRFLLVEFDTPLQCTIEEWKQAYFALTTDQWNALMKTKKSLMLHVGLGDQYKKWSPQDKALWQALKLQKVLRVVDRARRNPTLPSLREALVEVLEQGLQHTATNPALRYVVEETLIELGARPPDWTPWLGARHPEGLRVVDYVLPPDWEHQPLGWLPVWIEPGITKRCDTMFELVLRLLQWHMLESTSEINRFLDRYMKQFKYAFTEDERHLSQKGIALGGGEGFAEILRTDSYRESAKWLHQYIARTLHGRRSTAARRETKQSGQSLTVLPRSDGLYSVLDAVRILAREAYERQWTPSRDWLDDQMKAGRLPYVLDARGWKCLDEHGLQYARKLVKDEKDRRELVAYQMETLGKSRRAANKYLDEHTAKGESYADITTKFLPHRGREEG